MKKILIALLLFTAIAQADPVFMSDLNKNDPLLVSNNGEEFVPVTFQELCFIPTDKGFESIALIDFIDNTKSGHYASTYTTAKTPVESVLFKSGAMCSEDGERAYLVEKSQLLGILTQFQNMLSTNDAAKSLRAYADIFTRRDEALTELAEIRRIIKD